MNRIALSQTSCEENIRVVAKTVQLKKDCIVFVVWETVNGKLVLLFFIKLILEYIQI